MFLPKIKRSNYAVNKSIAICRLLPVFYLTCLNTPMQCLINKC